MFLGRLAGLDEPIVDSLEFSRPSGDCSVGPDMGSALYGSIPQ